MAHPSSISTIQYVAATTLVKYSSNDSAPSSSSGKSDRRTRTAVATLVLLGGLVILNLALLGSVFRSKCSRASQRTLSGVTWPALCSFTYKELEEATKGFSEELCNGAFGTVYKAKLTPEPRVLIAVKKLKSTIEMEAAEKNFTTETRTICLTHHKNLVRLLGFCNEGTHLLLVYEFMSNGSLDKILFGSDSPDWNQRIQIALGVGRGLAYLHEVCRTQIIHCDIKPQNILVDDNLDARISDFGLTKLLRLGEGRVEAREVRHGGYFLFSRGSGAASVMMKVVQMLEGTIEVVIPPIAYSLSM